MDLQLVRIHPNIATAADAKKLPPLAQQQLLSALRAYFGKKTSFTAAFGDGECSADGFRGEAVANPGVGLYDYWETNVDSGSVFRHGTLTSAGVEMIQNDFGIHTDEPNPTAEMDQLVEDLQGAPRVADPDAPYVFEEDEDGEEILADINRPDAVPADAKGWKKLLLAYKVTESFVRKYEAQFGPKCKVWWKIYTYTKLSEDYLRTHVAQLDWENVSYAQTRLSEEFLREFSDYLGWKEVSWAQNLSESFIRDFADRVDWAKIARYQPLSDAFIAEFADRIDFADLDMQQRSEAFIRAHQEQVDWEEVSEDAHLSEAFIREFQARVDWPGISKYQQLSTPFLEEFADRIEWSNLSFNRKLTDEQVRAYADRFNWVALVVFGRPLSEALVREHEAHIPRAGWQHLIERKRLSPAYKKEVQARLRTMK